MKPKRKGSARPGNASKYDAWRPPDRPTQKTANERTYRVHVDHLLAEYVDEVCLKESRPADVVMAALMTMGYLVYRRLRADRRIDKGCFSLGARYSGARLFLADVELFCALARATQEETDTWFVRHREEFERGRHGDDGHGRERDG